MTPEQDLPGILDAAEMGEGLIGENLQVLRRVVVDEGDGGVEVRRNDDTAARTAEHGLREGDALLAHLRPVAGQCGERGRGDSLAGGHQIGRGVRAMLGFDQEIERGQAPVRRFIGQDDGFARAGRNAGIDDVGEEPLGRDDEGAAVPKATVATPCAPPHL